MKPIKDKKTLMKKRIPTLVGLGVLVIGLIVGVVFLGAGPGVFAPRATPETTPSKIKLTNVTDAGFTVSFFTSSATPGFIKYGNDAGSVKSQTGDDRDQLSGTVGNYKLHHVTVRGLSPNTTYYYMLGTGTNASFDNNGAPFVVKTAARGGAPSAAKTAYGNVLNQSGSPASGSIVYANLQGVGEMSSLVKTSGSWAIPLSNARKDDGTGYAVISETDSLLLVVQGTTPSLISSVTTLVSDSQPVTDVTVGESIETISSTTDETETVRNDGDSAADDDDKVAFASEDAIEEFSTVDSGSGFGGVNVADDAGGLGDLTITEGDTPDEFSVEEDLLVDNSLAGEESVENIIVDLELDIEQIVTTQNPVITGLAMPNVVVTLIVNSDHQITQELIADEDGTFQLDIETLKETLEPGEHTATYTYVDPDTGLEVTKTVTFTVDLTANAGLGGSTETTPFGSGNPFSADATGSANATDSGDLATRSAVPATDSAVPVSGSVATTMAMVFGGIFFIMAGGWSYYLATQIEVQEI